MPLIITDLKYFKFWIVIFVLNSTIMTFLFINQAALFDIIFFLVQGFIINLGLLLMYYNVYTRFKAYHEGILYKYRLIF